jgi:hypothetical protein
MQLDLNLRKNMKTFEEFVVQKEVAAYDGESSSKDHNGYDPQSKQNLDIAMDALKRIIDTRPEIIISFLNQYRNDPDIKAILTRHKLDSFQDMRPKMNPHFTEKGLGDKTGQEPDALAPHSADVYSSDAN